MLDPKSSAWHTLGIVGSVGVQFVVSVGGSLLLGAWLDAQLETGWTFTLVGLVLGLIASGVVVYRLVRLLGTGASNNPAP